MLRSSEWPSSNQSDQDDALITQYLSSKKTVFRKNRRGRVSIPRSSIIPPSLQGPLTQVFKIHVAAVHRALRFVESGLPLGRISISNAQVPSAAQILGHWLAANHRFKRWQLWGCHETGDAEAKSGCVQLRYRIGN